MWQGEEDSKVPVPPNAAFSCSFVSHPLVLQAFHPPPHDSVEDARLLSLGLVLVLRCHVTHSCITSQKDDVFFLLLWVQCKARFIQAVYGLMGGGYDSPVLVCTLLWCGCPLHKGCGSMWAMLGHASLEDICSSR